MPETLKKVAEAAVVPTQSTKNLRADITAQEVYDAILEADPHRPGLSGMLSPVLKSKE